MKESEIINKIKLDLSRDSSQRAKENAAIEYSDWFYNERSHDLSLANQKLCGQRTIDITGIDVNTAVKVQTSVVRAYTIADRMLAAHETIQHHHLIASEQINRQLFSQAQDSDSVQSLKASLNSFLNSSYGTDLSKFGGIRSLEFYNLQAKNPEDPRHNYSVAKILQTAQEHRCNEEYNVTNSTKAIALVNCGINDYDLHVFSELFRNYTLKLDYLSFSSNNIQTPESIFYHYNSAHLHHKKFSNIKHIDFSNNNFGDAAAAGLANYLRKESFPSLESLDVHGNQITEVGYKHFIKALESPGVQDIAITLEVHKEPRTAWEFIKHAFNYIADAYSKKNAIADKELLVALYGDSEYAVCKKALADASHDIAVGMVKSMQNPTFAKTVQVVNTTQIRQDSSYNRCICLWI